MTKSGSKRKLTAKECDAIILLALKPQLEKEARLRNSIKRMGYFCTESKNLWVVIANEAKLIVRYARQLGLYKKKARTQEQR